VRSPCHASAVHPPPSCEWERRMFRNGMSPEASAYTDRSLSNHARPSSSWPPNPSVSRPCNGACHLGGSTLEGLIRYVMSQQTAEQPGATQSRSPEEWKEVAAILRFNHYTWKSATSPNTQKTWRQRAVAAYHCVFACVRKCYRAAYGSRYSRRFNSRIACSCPCCAA
jgi:hypothetical protein